MKIKRFVSVVLALLLSAAAWAAWSGPAASSGRRAAASPLAMGPGMMSGGMMGSGMMGGYGPGPNGYRQSPQGSAPNSRGGRLFAQACARCHALPDPRAHAPRQWPAVVARMEQYMRQSRIAVPDREQTAAIEAFLERHASAAR